MSTESTQKVSKEQGRIPRGANLNHHEWAEALVIELTRELPKDLTQTKVPTQFNRYVLILELLADWNLLPGAGYKRALDAGRGIGIISVLLAKAGFEVVSLAPDPLDASLRPLFQKYGIVDATGSVERSADVAKLGSFDLVLFFDVIEHLHGSPKRALSCMNSVLRPEGAFVASTPNFAHLRNRVWLVFGRSTYRQQLEDFFRLDDKFEGHYREYTLDEFTMVLRMSGMRVRRVCLTNRPLVTSRRLDRSLGESKATSQFRHRAAMAAYLLLSRPLPRLRFAMFALCEKETAGE